MAAAGWQRRAKETCAVRRRCKERRRWAGSGSSGDRRGARCLQQVVCRVLLRRFRAGRRSGGAPLGWETCPHCASRPYTDPNCGRPTYLGDGGKALIALWTAWAWVGRTTLLGGPSSSRCTGVRLRASGRSGRSKPLWSLPLRPAEAGHPSCLHRRRRCRRTTTRPFAAPSLLPGMALPASRPRSA